MDRNKKSILIVDDENSNIITLTHILSPNYTVYAAKSGQLAIKAAKKHLPDIILLDILMPEMDGYEVLSQIKSDEETANIPVIFLTAKGDNVSELAGLSLGAVDYISKPFSPSLLLKRIEIRLLLESQKQELADSNNSLEEEVAAKAKTVTELQGAVLKTMADLVDFRDDVTGRHTGRIHQYLSVMLGMMEEKGVYKEEIASWDIALVLRSAQLHDVGKIAITDDILKKADKLTDEEFDKIKSHTDFGLQIIEKIKESTTEHAFLEHAKIFATTHHEKWDGTGYPNGLRGEEIPLKGRLMAIVDVYDALVSERTYKKAHSHVEAVAIIEEGRGKHFDPALVDVFHRCADRFEEITVQSIA